MTVIPAQPALFAILVPPEAPGGERGSTTHCATEVGRTPPYLPSACSLVSGSSAIGSMPIVSSPDASTGK